jgi:hypothetical protein
MFLGTGVLIVLSLLACPASAQEAGTILGVVRDASGGTVPDARITITNVDTSEMRTAATGDDGAFRVPGLRPGHYSVKVEKDGFKTSNQTSLTLNVAQELVLSPLMQVGSASQEVTVTGEAPIINTTTSALGALVDDQRIADLPLNGRNYLDLTLIQPGIQVNSSPSGGGSGSSGTWFSSNGMPPRSNTYTLDGALIGNQYGTGPNSISGSTLGVDGIKEYKIVTNMFGPEYAMTMGSQMVIVSKGGSNQWHGDMFEYLRNNHMDARNFFEAQPSLLGGQRLSQFKRNNFGAAGGGPIKKDKTFFYLVYEGLRTAQQDAIQDTTLPAACHFVNINGTPVILGGGAIPSTVTLPPGFTAANQQILNSRASGTVTMATTGCGSLAAGASLTNPSRNPVLANMTTPWIGQFPFPNENIAGVSSNYTFPGQTHVREDYGQLRIDQNISESDTFFSRYTFDDNRLVTPYNNLSASDTGNGYPQFFSLGVSRNQYVTFGENHVFSTTMFNQGRLSFSRTNFIGRPGVRRVSDLNPDFDLIDTPSTPGSTCFAASNPVCVWSYLPRRFNGGFGPGNGVTTLSYNTTFPTYHPQNLWTLADDVFVAHSKHAFKMGILMNNYQEPSVMQKGASGNDPSNAVGNWMQGIATGTITVVTPTPGFSSNGGILSSQYHNSYYLDKTYMFKTFGFYVGDDYRATSRLTLNLGLRYEFGTIPHELYGRSSVIYNLQAGSPTFTLGPLFNHNASLRNWSPRFGFAWDIFGNGRTSVRGGVGMYYDLANIGSMLTQSANGVPPFGAQTQVAEANAPITIPYVDVNGNPVNVATGLASPAQTNFTTSQLGHALQMSDPNIKSPHSVQYNLTVERQLPLGIGLSASYVGNRGINLYALVEGNPVVPTGTVNGQPVYYDQTLGPGNVPRGQVQCFNNALTNGQPFTIGGMVVPSTDPRYPCRMNPYWTSALFITSPSNSWYNALQVSVTKRLSHGLDFQGAYTYSREIDTTEGQMYNTDCGLNVGTAVGFFPGNLNLDKGPGCADVPHSFHMSLLYQIPGFKSGGFVSKLTNGWSIQNVVSVVEGTPFSPVIAQDRSFSGVITQGNSTRPNLNSTASTVQFPGNSNTYNFIPFDPKTVITGDPNNWYNPLMFSEAALGTIGNAPRNILRLPGLGDWDFSVHKDTKLGFLGEQGALQFRAEFFNLLNRANFGPVGSTTVFNGTTVANNFPANTPNSALGGTIQAPFGSSSSNPLGSVGQITTTRTTSRQIQLALKLVF